MREYLIVGVCSTLLTWACAAIVTTAHQAYLDKQVTLNEPATWQPPKIDCPGDMELWDCIRHGRYQQ